MTMITINDALNVIIHRLKLFNMNWIMQVEYKLLNRSKLLISTEYLKWVGNETIADGQIL